MGWPYWFRFEWELIWKIQKYKIFRFEQDSKVILNVKYVSEGTASVSCKKIQIWLRIMLCIWVRELQKLSVAPNSGLSKTPKSNSNTKQIKRKKTLICMQAWICSDLNKTAKLYTKFEIYEWGNCQIMPSMDVFKFQCNLSTFRLGDSDLNQYWIIIHTGTYLFLIRSDWAWPRFSFIACLFEKIICKIY